MSVLDMERKSPPPDETSTLKDWHYHPALPIRNAALFDWPFRVSNVGRWLVSNWLSINLVTIWLGLSTVVYFI